MSQPTSIMLFNIIGRDPVSQRLPYETELKSKNVNKSNATVFVSQWMLLQKIF